MKKYILPILILVIALVLLFFPNLKEKAGLGGQLISTDTTLVGSATQLKAVPQRGVATTTVDQAFTDAPTAIVQDVSTEGATNVILNIMAKGATATSTIFVQQFGSYDGTTYFNIASSSVDTVFNATSSLYAVSQNRAFEVNPGTATSTISKKLDIAGYNYVRFIFWDDRGVASHLNSIKAYITATKVEENR